MLTRAQVPDEDDPLLVQFLTFLSSDIASHPECLQTIDASFVRRLRSLTDTCEVNLDASLAADDE